MIEGIVSELGPWTWVVLGFVLLALEIAIPGVFLLWIGIAALVTGALSLLIWDFGLWTWQAQTITFLILSLVSAYAGKRIARNRETETDQPLLNQRSEQMIGRTATLAEPILEGRGRIRLGDTLWRVNGPDLPKGTRVRVTRVAGSELFVEPF